MSYWSDREIKTQANIYNLVVGRAEKELAERYRQAYKRISKKMANVYAKIMASEDPLASDLYKYDKYYELQSLINSELTKLGIKENKVINKHMTDLYKKNVSFLSLSFGLQNTYDPEVALKAINSIWCADGMNWSSRVWKSKSLLLSKLEDELVQCVVRGASTDEAAKEIMNTFNSGYANASRLIRTELSYILNKASLDKYMEAGILYYRILSDQADDDCKNQDKKLYRLNDASIGVNMPPFHPNCRCTIIPEILG